VAILTHLGNALTAPDSRILIDDTVMPEVNAPWVAVSIDVQMLAVYNGVERTERQWHNVLDRAGLRIEEIKLLDPTTCMSVIFVARK
jgi:demethylsterigmatocystin 6-O-methyltransferase